MHLTPEEIDSLRAKADSLGSTIQELSKKHSSLLRQINDARSSTRTLPPEILSIIFQLAHPAADPSDNYVVQIADYKRPRDILKLCHVSSRWRAVAFSTPQLWTKLIITLAGWTNSHNVSHVLANHFQNVGGLPFSLEIRCPFPVPTASLEPVEKVLFREENGRKVDFLLLGQCLPREWIFYISDAFSNLTYLSLINLSTHGPTPLLEEDFPVMRAPHLKTISLYDSPAIFDLSPSWEGITRLSLFSMRTSTCAKLLLRCPNLIEFRRSDPFGECEPLSDIIGVHTFPYLVDFAWACTNEIIDDPCYWCHSVVANIRLPSVKNFSWTNNPGHEGADIFRPRLHAMLAGATTTLEELFINVGVRWSESDLKELFTSFKHLLAFGLGSCNTDTVSTLIAILTPGTGGDDTRYLPSLEALCIRIDVDHNGTTLYPPDDLYILSPKFVKMFQKRVDSDGNLRFSLDVPMEWDQDSLEKLQELNKNGAELILIDDAQPESWPV